MHQGRPPPKIREVDLTTRCPSMATFTFDSLPGIPDGFLTPRSAFDTELTGSRWWRPSGLQARRTQPELLVSGQSAFHLEVATSPVPAHQHGDAGNGMNGRAAAGSDQQ